MISLYQKLCSMYLTVRKSYSGCITDYGYTPFLTVHHQM
nr:MAG TPA: hypothetical protein [Caudoviricetes sp.]